MTLQNGPPDNPIRPSIILSAHSVKQVLALGGAHDFRQKLKCNNDLGKQLSVILFLRFEVKKLPLVFLQQSGLRAHYYSLQRLAQLRQQHCEQPGFRLGGHCLHKEFEQGVFVLLVQVGGF